VKDLGYLQTGFKHGRNPLELLTGLWTSGAWMPTIPVPDTG